MQWTSDSPRRSWPVGHRASSGGVQFDVAESGFPVGVIEDARVEAVLPDAASGALGGIAVSGVLAVHLHHEVRDRILAIANRDQMEMVGHQGVSGDADVAFLGV